MTRDPRKVSELSLHKAVVQHLKLRAAPGVVWLHPANGEVRSTRTGAKLKALGVLPGASDLLIFIPRRGNGPDVCCLEFKSGKGRLSNAQYDFAQAVLAIGAFHAVASSIDGALKQLVEWRAIT